MNAFARDLSTAANRTEAMARDLFGFASLPSSAITYHSILSTLDSDSDLSLVDSTWPAGTLVESHAHHGKDEVVIVLSGIVEVRIAGRRLRRGAGETAFIPRGAEHEVRALTEARHISILTRKSLQGPSPE